MTTKEAIAYLNGLIREDYKEQAEALNMAIKALEQQPCEDCISREAVDEYITNLLSGYLYDEERTRLEDLTTYIWELPSVTSHPKIGQWINLENTKYKGQVLPFWDRYECSKCGGHGEGTSNYCPNCGAKMEADA